MPWHAFAWSLQASELQGRLGSINQEMTQKSRAAMALAASELRRTRGENESRDAPL